MVIDKEPFVLESVEPLWNFAGTKGRRASVFCFGDPACKQVRSPIQFPSLPLHLPFRSPRNIHYCTILQLTLVTFSN